MHVAFISNVRDLFQSHTLTLDKVAHAVFAVHSRLHFLHNINSQLRGGSCQSHASLSPTECVFDFSKENHQK